MLRWVYHCYVFGIFIIKVNCDSSVNDAHWYPCASPFRHHNCFEFDNTLLPCRPEDGYYQCPDSTLCVARELLRDVRDPCSDDFGSDKNAIICNRDEFLCRLTWRCIPRYLLNTRRDCLYENIERVAIPCRRNEYFCAKSSRCIPRWLVQNGKVDCSSLETFDNSDETDVLACNENEFQCSVEKNELPRCIPREWVSNGYNDCIQGKPSVGVTTDEFASFDQCLYTEFMCGGRCLLRQRVMDGFPDCIDGMDESIALRECFPNEFRCSNGRCIPRMWVGDGTNNCLDKNDEISITTDSCTVDEFECANKHCVALLYKCDGIDHCGDCSDEIEECDSPAMTRCPSNNKCIINSYICDSYDDCPRGEENQLLIPGFKCMKTVNSALVKYCALPQQTLHNSLSMCDDNSDLCWDNGQFICSYCLDNSTIIAKRQVCDGVVDCPDLSDECLCFGKHREPVYDLCKNVISKNPIDDSTMLHCDRNRTLVFTNGMVCDGKIDCPTSKVDEKFCTKRIEQPPNETGFDFDCWDHSQYTDVLQTVSLLEAFKNSVSERAKKCDGIFECARFEDECNSDCVPQPVQCEQFKLLTNSVPPFPGVPPGMEVTTRQCPCEPDKLCKYWTLNFLFGSNVCNGVQDCWNGLDEENCKNEVFNCDSGTITWAQNILNRTNVPQTAVCDGKIDCSVDQNDERNCSGDYHYYCENSQPLFVPKTKVLDGFMDCSDNSDECPKGVFADNPFSSREELLSNKGFLVIIHIVAIAAIAGNFAVISVTSRKLCAGGSTNQNNKIVTVNKILILSLAFSDLLMGIALGIIAFKSISTSGVYCQINKSWRVSTLCKAIGVLVVTSSEATVSMLVIMTSYRLRATLRPLQAGDTSIRGSILAVVFAWSLSIFVSILPLSQVMESSMVTGMLTMQEEYFHSDVITLDKLQIFAKRLCIFSNKNITYTTTGWSSTMRFLEENFPSYAPKNLGYFGYYSAHGVCMPKMYNTHDGEELNALTMAILTANFVSILYIISAYCVIYRKARESNSTVENTDALRQNKRLQRNITVLVATDTLCWLPICIMFLVSVTVKPLNSMTYAFSAILLLPINSSLNPLIYSNVIQTLCKKVR